MCTSVSANAAHWRITLMAIQGISNLPPKTFRVKAEYGGFRIR
jgi:hypothetical protein